MERTERSVDAPGMSLPNDYCTVVFRYSRNLGGRRTHANAAEKTLVVAFEGRRMRLDGCAPQGRMTKCPDFRDAIVRWKRACYAIK